MERISWEDSRRPLIARLAGIAGIAYVALAVAPASLGGPYFDNISSSQVLDFAKRNGGAISADGFIGGLSASVLAVFVILLVGAIGGRGSLAVLAWNSMAAMMAVNWMHAGANYALADAGQRGQADAGIIALFSLAKMLTFADGFAFGMAVIALSLVALGLRTLPRALALLGVVVGAYYLINTPVQLAINHSAAGITGPIGVVLGLLWILAIAVVVLIKPVWGRPVHSTQAVAS